MARFRLHIANKNYSSWSLRPWLVMRVFDIPFDEVLWPFTDSDTQPDFFKFNPAGKVPCLHDLEPAGGDDTSSSSSSAAAKKTVQEPLVVPESLAITEYLAETHPDKAIWPRDVRARAFARAAAAEMAAGFSAVRNELGMSVGVRVELEQVDTNVSGGSGEEQTKKKKNEPLLSRALRRDLRRIEALWDEGLTRFGGPWLAGAEFCAADAFYAPVALRLQTYGVELGSAPARAYGERLLQEVAPLKEWVADALDETWRDATHEKETMVGRKLLADYRKTG